MIKGMYAAASAMIAGMKRQSALAHNVANLDTPGFRQILLAMDDWYVTPVRQNSQTMMPQMDVNHMSQLGYVGLGSQTSPEITDFSQGGMKASDNELDFAINGTGFFRVKTSDGERYTRDGRFLRDANNQLVTVNGYQVLNTNGQVITLPEGAVRIDESGNISGTNGVQVAQIGLAAFKDPNTELTRDGMNTFAAKGAPTDNNPGTVQQGYLEMSNVNLTRVVATGRAYEAAQRMVQMADETTGKMLSSLSR
ncbi:MAG: flagellar hook-basal body protein [Chloroflexota bacterium]